MRRDSSTPRLGWPFLLLVVGAGCIVLALVETVENIRSNEVVLEHTLTGYANFASWSYAEHVTDKLGTAAQEVLGGVNMVHISPPVPDARNLGHGLPWDVACACHRPRFGPMPSAYLGFTLGSDTLEVGRNLAPPQTEGWLVDPPSGLMPASRAEPAMPPAARRWLVDTLTRLARAPRAPDGFQFLLARIGDSTMYIAVTTMPTMWGDTLVYAVQYRAAVFDSLLNAVLDDRSLLPGTLVTQHSNREVVAVEVRDAAGQPLFAPQPPVRWALDATSRLPANFGGLTIRMRIQPALAEDIVIGGLPGSRVPMLLALLLLAAGLTVIAAVQLRREARFARDRSAFVASVSHELRTPLAQIRLVTDMLRLDREPDPARRDAAVSLVDREVTRLQHLVESVLRFTRGERPGEAAAIERVDVVTEVRTTVAEFAPLAEPRRISIDVVAVPTSMVALRAGALRQVLLNLLDNAVKYGPDGGRITVSVAPGAGGSVRLAVRDQGPGIPAPERERIWQAFERGSAAGRRAVGGSGIGLTVVREIAQLHGGTARVGDRNGDGGGAEFVVEFPRAGE